MKTWTDSALPCPDSKFVPVAAFESKTVGSLKKVLKKDEEKSIFWILKTGLIVCEGVKDL